MCQQKGTAQVWGVTMVQDKGSLDDGSSQSSDSAADASSKLSAGTILGITVVVFVFWMGN
jgi:hypothetical protein